MTHLLDAALKVLLDTLLDSEVDVSTLTIIDVSEPETATAWCVLIPLAHPFLLLIVVVSLGSH